MENKSLKLIIAVLGIILLTILGIVAYNLLNDNIEVTQLTATEKADLYNAIIDGDINSYDAYLDDGKNLSFAFTDGTTPIEKLIEANDLYSAEKIVNSGFDLQLVENNHIDTISNIILYNKNFQIEGINDISKVLIKQVADEIEAEDSDGYSLLINAIYANNTELVNEILKYVDDVDKVYNGETALTFATSKGGTNLEIVQALVAKGANLNYQGEDGNTATMYAVMNYDQRILTYLLNLEGTKINIQNDYGQTVLHIAVDYYNVAAIEPILTKGVDRTIVDNEGYTAKSYAKKIGFSDLYDRL